MALGNYDIGICSLTWVEELAQRFPSHDVVRLCDLGYGAQSLWLAGAGDTTDPNDPNSKRELVMVDFTHTRKDVDAAGAAVTKESFIKVPLLAMLQIPSLRIDHVEIIFNVKLNSVETSSVSDKLNVGTEFKGGWGPVSLKVSVAYQRLVRPVSSSTSLSPTRLQRATSPPGRPA